MEQLGWSGLCRAGRGQRGLRAVADQGEGQWEMTSFLLGSHRFFFFFFFPGEAAVPWEGSRAELWGLCSPMGLAAGPGSLTCLCTLGLEGSHKLPGESAFHGFLSTSRASLERAPEVPSPGVAQSWSWGTSGTRPLGPPQCHLLGCLLRIPSNPSHPSSEAPPALCPPQPGLATSSGLAVSPGWCFAAFGVEAMPGCPWLCSR